MTDACLSKAYSERARHWRQAARNWAEGGNLPAANECLQQASRFERLAAAAAALPSASAPKRSVGRVAPEMRRPLRRAAG